MAPVGIRCPEHSGRPLGVQRVTHGVRRASFEGVGARVTRTLIALNVAVYVAELATGGGVNGVGSKIYQEGALIARGIKFHGLLLPAPKGLHIPHQLEAGVAYGDWWRLLSAAFLHYGPFHLLMNMFALYWFGSLLEQRIGSGRFLLLYVAAGLAGSAGALIAQPNAFTAGASGAIFGLAGALLVMERSGAIDTGGQLLMILILNLVITFQYRDSISIGGHVGGLIGGVVAMVLLLPVRRSAPLSLAILVGIAAASVVVAYAVV